jgi:hypothetical protein
MACSATLRGRCACALSPCRAPRAALQLSSQSPAPLLHLSTLNTRHQTPGPGAPTLQAPQPPLLSRYEKVPSVLYSVVPNAPNAHHRLPVQRLHLAHHPPPASTDLYFLTSHPFPHRSTCVTSTWPSSSHLPATFLPPSCHLPATFLPPSCPTFLPHLVLGAHAGRPA